MWLGKLPLTGVNSTMHPTKIQTHGVLELRIDTEHFIVLLGHLLAECY